MQNIKKITAFLCATTLICSSISTVGCVHTPHVEENEIKNVILFIGDGMGEHHLENALTYFDLDTPNFFQGRQGYIATHSANNPITDSAAGATALATGHKVNNGEVAYHNGENLTSISELALAAGKKVGIVTTDSLSGATPAGFSSHAKNRGDVEEIVQGQATSGIHLFIGETGSGAYENYAPLFTENGYEFATTPEEMTDLSNSQKLITTIPNPRSQYLAGFEQCYQLKEMVSFALDFLENENGYFLMIEGAYIDKFSHNNDLIPALCETRSLIDCMSFLYETVSDDTALILTADHETGGLIKATTKEEIANNLYLLDDHTAANVPLFIKNFTYTYNGTPQNTEIFNLCKTLLKI